MMNSRADGLEDLGEAAHGHRAVRGWSGSFCVLEDAREEDIEVLGERRADDLAKRDHKERMVVLGVVIIAAATNRQVLFVPFASLYS